VRGDTGPTNHAFGILNPQFSVLTSTSPGYAGNNKTTAPAFVSQYCNGSRVPPECTVTDGCAGPKGFGVPPGIADALTPNPVFSFTPSATVDEGNNWINVSWGPLALTNPAQPGPALPGTASGNYGGGPALANYNFQAAFPADEIPAGQPHPATDFYGNLRPEPNEGNPARFDPGAIEFGSTVGTASFSVSPSSLAFGAQSIASPSAPQTITVTNTGTVALNGGSFTFTGSTAFTSVGPGCTGTLAIGANCTINVQFRPTAAGTNYNGSVAIAYNGPATGTGTPVSLTGSGVVAGPLAFTAATNGTLSNFGGRTLTFTIPTGRPSVTSVVTITNQGPAASTPVAITAESVIGVSNTLFTLSGNTCGATLAPGVTCTISITYATPAAPPSIFTPHLGVAAVANNGGGTIAGSSVLGLIGR
jgi:hypothetical protein